jgi:rhamnose utilization protein RhaD (predicted bifunctional aldolase and dehydrogenase)
MNDNQLLQDYVRMSKTAGNRADYVQGGGGNTSVKLSEGRMAVKASGFRLNQIGMDDAYVVVDAKAIRQWYSGVNLAEDRDFEKESVAAAKGAVVPGFGPQGLRPSVEAGFHAVLGSFVIHTHAVQANLLCCSAEGQGLMEKLFTNAGFPAIWIPYINPGFCLTLKIKAAREAMIAATGNDPHIIFMENHGLIVWGDDADFSLRLHDEVNGRILDYFKLADAYPVPSVKPFAGAGTTAFAAALASAGISAVGLAASPAAASMLASDTPEVRTFLKEYKADVDFFERYPLYPDQLVYLNSGMIGAADSIKVFPDAESGSVLYRAGESEALAMEETLLGYAWVIGTIKKTGLKLKTMSSSDVAFIRNWESEAYRRSLVAKMAK